jgi:hypothetical protein
MFFTQQSVYGAVIPSNTTTFGAKTAVDKKIEFNVGTAQKPAIRANATTNALEFSNDGTGFRAIGSGSGGLSSYIANKDFETDSSGVAAYANTAGTNPSGATPAAGGSPVRVSFARNTTSPLVGSGDLKFIKASGGAGQGEGLSINFTIPNVYAGGPQQIVFPYDATDANYVSGAVVVCIVEVAATQVVLPIFGADNGLCKSLPKAKGTFTATFNATATLGYRLAFHVASNSVTAAYNLFFDDISIGSLILPSGVPVSDWVAYTPTLAGNGSKNCSSQGNKYRRVGDQIQIAGAYSCDTVASGAGGTVLSVTLPTGLTIDTTKINGTAPEAYAVLGTGYEFGITTNASNTNFVVVYGSTNTFAFMRPGTAQLRYTQSELNISRSMDFAYNLMVPVSQWSGSANIVNGPQVEYACNTGAWDTDDTTNFNSGCVAGQLTGGTLTANREKQVRFLTAIQPTDILTLEFVKDGASNWGAAPTIAGAGGEITSFALQSTTYYGAALLNRSTLPVTDTSVNFARYRFFGATYGGAGDNWTSNIRWRVKKESNVASRALAEAVPGVSNGFLSYLGVKGRTNGSSTAAGYVGEVLLPD